jgi:UDP-glucose 4-epimerase
MRVLVTGGAGFIGTNLVRKLLTQGHDVAVLDDFTTGLRSNVADLPIALFEGDFADLATVMEAGEGADWIVHLGARGSVPRSIKNPMKTHAANATGSLNVLEAARHSGSRVIMVSSSSVYGANSTLPKTERMWTAPLTPYAASKLAAEAYAMAYAQSYQVPVMTFRFFNVFGPWQRPDHDYAAVIPKWIWAALHDEPLRVFGDGSTTRDFTYVDDVVQILIRVMSEGITHPEPVNLAFGNSISLETVLDTLQKEMGTKLPISFEPARVGDVAHSQNDPTLLRSLIPDLQPRNFDDALRETIDWLQRDGAHVAGGPAVQD